MTGIYTLASVIVVSLVSVVGVVALSLSGRLFNKIISALVALSVGALFGDVFFHILPELLEEGEARPIFVLVSVGLLLFFILEKFLRWHHHHHEETGDDCIKPFGYLNLFADGAHNFLDGMIIAASYLVSPAVGVATTVAVIFHEIPQEIGDFAVLVKAGFSKTKALVFNLLSAGLAILGAGFVLALGTSGENLASYVLPLAAGGFLYIAGSDLVPELHDHHPRVKEAVIQLLAIIVGLGLMIGLTFLE